jgi:hypothetical protein
LARHCAARRARRARARQLAVARATRRRLRARETRLRLRMRVRGRRMAAGREAGVRQLGALAALERRGELRLVAHVVDWRHARRRPREHGAIEVGQDGCLELARDLGERGLREDGWVRA